VILATRSATSELIWLDHAAEVILQRSGRKLNYIMDYADRSDGFRTFTGFDPQPDIHNLYHRLNTASVQKENI
jgi:hypothetical protein